jgi:hypothetical protein
MDLSKYRQAIEILYPCRPEALYEQMELELQASNGGMYSTSASKISTEAVREQVKSMLRKRLEPNQRAFRRLYMRYDTQNRHWLSLYSFLDALYEILPTASRDIATQHYRISEHDYAPNEVGIERLGQITAYLFVHQCSLAQWGFTDSRTGSNPSKVSVTTDSSEMIPGIQIVTEEENGVTIKVPTKGMTEDNPVTSSELSMESSKQLNEEIAMPNLLHLQDDLVLHSRLEPDEDEELEMRRMEKALTIPSTAAIGGGMVAALAQALIS